MAPRRCILVVAELKEDFRRLIEHQRLIDRGICEPEAHDPLAFEMRRRVVALMEAMFSSRPVGSGLLHPEVTLRCPGAPSREGVAQVSAYLAQTSKARAAAPPQTLRVVIRADHLLVTQHTAFVTVDFETEFVRSQCFFRISTAPPSNPYSSITRLPDDYDLSKPLPVPVGLCSGTGPAVGSKKTRGGAPHHDLHGGIRSIDASFDVREFVDAIVREDVELRQQSGRFASRPGSADLTSHASSSSPLGLNSCPSPGGLELFDLMGLSQSKCPSYFGPSSFGDCGLPPLDGPRKRTRTSGGDSACTSEALSLGDNDDLSGPAASFLDDPFDRELLMCFSPLQGIGGEGDALVGRLSGSDPYIDPFLDTPQRPLPHPHHLPSSSSSSSRGAVPGGLVSPLGLGAGLGLGLGEGGEQAASPLTLGMSSWTREVTHTSEV